MTGSTLYVSEVFGPTVQGEGPHSGERCGFVRLGMCNLSCSWCDTPYTWDWQHYDKRVEVTAHSIPEVVEQVVEMGVGRVVVTGGEPLIQRNGVVTLARELEARGMRTEVETNGTFAPLTAARVIDWWNVSPKLANSGMTRAEAWRPVALAALAGTGRVAFKFVCTTPSDLDEIAELVDLAGLEPRTVWIMPEGRSVAVISERMAPLATAAIAAGYNVTGRLHVTLWGDERGH